MLNWLPQNPCVSASITFLWSVKDPEAEIMDFLIREKWPHQEALGAGCMWPRTAWKLLMGKGKIAVLTIRF